MRIKRTEIEVIKGDITSLGVCAIVADVDTEINMEDGLAKIIYDKGCKDVVIEAKKYLPLSVGDAVISTASQLPAKNVIHAVTRVRGESTDQDKLRLAVASTLECAMKMNLTSIAFSAIGSSDGGLPLVGIAKILLQEIFKVCQHTNTCLKKITICLSDEETFKVFDKTIRGYLRHLQEDLGPGPYVTTDIIIEMNEGIILIERSNPPYGWALPGGFLDYGESLEECAMREAKEETNLELEELRQFHTYSEMGRDPRFQTISTVFIGKGIGKPQFGDDARNLEIVPYEKVLNFDYAFDHKKIISDYLKFRKKR